MATIINRTLSGLFATAYLVAAYMHSGPPATVKCFLFLILPMACIWFSEEMGACTGVMGARYVDTESPGCMVAVAGWVLLLLPVIAGLILYFQNYWL